MQNSNLLIKIIHFFVNVICLSIVTQNKFKIIFDFLNLPIFHFLSFNTYLTLRFLFFHIFIIQAMILVVLILKAKSLYFFIFNRLIYSLKFIIFIVIIQEKNSKRFKYLKFIFIH